MKGRAFRLGLLLAVSAAVACSRRPVPFGSYDGSSWGLDRGRSGERRFDQWLDGPRDASRDHPVVPTCTPGARLTYVVDDAARVHTFDPSSSTPLLLKGTLQCPLSGHPHSMAVRHDGIAYVLYSYDYHECSGLARVDLNTLACSAVSTFRCGSGGFDLFGMGYALAGDHGQETLFIAAMAFPELAQLDPETGKETTVGELPALSLELTGNSKGELWGFTPDPSAMVYRLDPTTGAALLSFDLRQIPTGMGLSSAWAFAAWGGVFYIFYGHQESGGSNVYRLTPDGTLTTFLTTTGINIVGAGNAVCAGL